MSAWARGNGEEHDGRAATNRPGRQAPPLPRGAGKWTSRPEALLVKLAPAWGELRKILNEVNRVLESSRAGSAARCGGRFATAGGAVPTLSGRQAGTS